MEEISFKILKLINNAEDGKEWSFKNKEDKQPYIDAIKYLIERGHPIELSSNMDGFRRLYLQKCSKCGRKSYPLFEEDEIMVCDWCYTKKKELCTLD